MDKSTNIDQDYVIEYRKQLGLRLREARKQGGLTLLQVGQQVGVNDTTIGKIENGKFPTQIDMYIKLAIVLNLKIEIK